MESECFRHDGDVSRSLMADLLNQKSNVYHCVSVVSGNISQVYHNHRLRPAPPTASASKFHIYAHPHAAGEIGTTSVTDSLFLLASLSQASMGRTTPLLFLLLLLGLHQQANSRLLLVKEQGPVTSSSAAAATSLFIQKEVQVGTLVQEDEELIMFHRLLVDHIDYRNAGIHPPPKNHHV